MIDWILVDSIVGPIFFRETLAGDAYLNMLEDIIDPVINEEVDNDLDAEDNQALTSFCGAIKSQ